MARRIAERGLAMLWERKTLTVFRILPHQVVTIASDLPAAVFATAVPSEFRESSAGPQVIPQNLRHELHSSHPDQQLHLFRVGDTVASWGFSASPIDKWPLTETRSELLTEPGAICLYAFETIPEYRGRRLYPAMLSQILAGRFADGGRVAYIWCLQENRSSYRSIKRVGFVEIAVHTYLRILGVSFRRRLSLADHDLAQ